MAAEPRARERHSVGLPFVAAPAEAVGGSAPFSKTVLGQSVCAAGAGLFQVYSGGIAIDTISTRMQAGATAKEATFGKSMPASVPAFIRQLYSGHAVMAKGRFPYLFTNLNCYNGASKSIADSSWGRKASGEKSLLGELFCISCSTVAGAAVITAIECPKILAQLDGPGATGKAPTIASVVREQGLGRLMRGYDACICREGLFNMALLGSPAASRAVRERVLAPARLESDARERAGAAPTLLGRFARLIDGKEMLFTSLCAGLTVGFITNGPDQLKTRIQHGQFRSLPEAFAWQMRAGGGIRALYGPAAVYRGLYTGHGVLALNFMRHKVEHFADQIMSG